MALRARLQSLWASMRKGWLKVEISNVGIHNFSKYSITKREQCVLALGPSFATTPPARRAPLLDHTRHFIKAVRTNCRYGPTERRNNNLPKLYIKPSDWSDPVEGYPQLENWVNERVSYLKTLQSRKFTPTALDSPISWIPTTAHAIKSNLDIKAVLADKNMGICLLDSDAYVNECFRQLMDRNTYIYLGTMDLDNLRGDTNRLLSDTWTELDELLVYHGFYRKDSGEWLNGKHQPKTALRNYMEQARSNKSLRLATFYCLWKIHKSPIVGRPICSTCSTATEAASRFLAITLQPLLKRTIPEYCQSSTEALLAIEDLNSSLVYPGLQSSTRVATLDITALYPSIPTEFGLEILQDWLILNRNLIEKDGIAQLNILFLYDLAKWVLDNNLIRFGNHAFRQVKGTAMGTNFAVAYANIVIAHIMTKATDAANDFLFRESFNPDMDPRPVKINLRYIDDILLIGNETWIWQFRTHFNGVCASIQLDEWSLGYTANFLDLAISVISNATKGIHLSTRLYSKPQNAYLYIPANSLHSGHMFQAFINAEISRYRLMCMVDSDYLDLRKLLFLRLRSRGYSERYLYLVFSNHLPSRPVLLAGRRMAATKPKSRSVPTLLFKVEHNPQTRYLQPFLHTALSTASLPYEEKRRLFRNQPATICWLNPPTLGKMFMSNNICRPLPLPPTPPVRGDSNPNPNPNIVPDSPTLTPSVSTQKAREQEETARINSFLGSIGLDEYCITRTNPSTIRRSTRRLPLPD